MRARLLWFVAAAALAAVAAPAAAFAAWGGRITASDGEAVTIRASDSYPQDPALLQKWADFLAGLVHGPELATVTLYVAPLDEVQQTCGPGAYACYDARDALIIAPADAPAPDVSAEAVITHEYGHHVAASRRNPPWNASNYGTKRWATYENVCARSRAGVLFPGAETGSRYTLNPGEGFAETYRVLNERREGVMETPWDVVDQLLYPDAGALAALQQDIVSPWTADTRVSFAGAVAHGRVRTFALGTPYDGTLRTTVHATGGPVRFTLVAPTGRRAATTTIAAGATRSVSTTVCGTRRYSLRLASTAGSARFSVSAARP